MQAAVVDIVQGMKEISMVMAVTEAGLLAQEKDDSHSLLFPLLCLPYREEERQCEEERQWFNQAMQAAVVDIVQRMKEISMVMAVTEEGLLAQGVAVDELEGMLDELQEHVESIDMANDLKAIGGLEPLLRFLKSPHAILLARAAEVVTTMVQNNEKSQRSVMEAGGHLTLMDMLLNDVDITARSKAVGAISSLVRHNPEGLASLGAVVGIKGLTSLISSAAQPNTNTTTGTDTTTITTSTTTSSTTTTSTGTGSTTKLLLKALHLMLYFLQQFPSDRSLALSSGLLASLLQPGVVGSQDGDDELDALLATRRALIGRKVAAARGESGGGYSGGATGDVGGGEAGAGGSGAAGAAAGGMGAQQPLMFLGAR
ncbi:unnamed protein product [Closterium sp. Naga37s-1]|nr:unnamed protein product [Closterium sp. Naga37s-1]